MNRYSIKEISQITEIKAHTLRYYESMGLIEEIEKDSSGNRSYTEADLDWIFFLKKIKNTKMKINKILEYVELKKEGNSTIANRKKILEDHLNSLQNEIELMNETKKYIEWKIELYDKNLVK